MEITKTFVGQASRCPALAQSPHIRGTERGRPASGACFSRVDSLTASAPVCRTSLC